MNITPPVAARDAVGHAVILPSLTPCAITVRTVRDAGKSCAGTDLVSVHGVDSDGWPVRMFLAPGEMLPVTEFTNKTNGKAA